jgi:hypothetical protein
MSSGIAILRRPPRGARALAFACALAAGAWPGAASAQSFSAPSTESLVDAVTRYAQFVSAHPLADADRRRIEAAETADLSRRPADADVDRRVMAFLASAQTLRGPALEAARTSAWNSILAGSKREGGSLDPVTATVLRYNPVVASDPRTGIAVSMHALQGYAQSENLTARLGGHPALGNLDASRIAPALASTFATYSPEAQRMVADGAERWIALKERVDGASAGSLDSLRQQLAAGTLTPDGVARATRLLQGSAMHQTVDEMVLELHQAFAAGFSAFGSQRGVAP